MTIYKTLLSRGYFPKELPPNFFTHQFATYATTRNGSQVLRSYEPRDNSTQCVEYRLALPGLYRRSLEIPHPASYSVLARLTAQHFRRLLKKAHRSPFVRSRPVYADNLLRALHGAFKSGNLARERMKIRAGASFLVKTDISQFYPSLYTHAVGWAVDPQLRQRVHWRNNRLLGAKLDQALMNLQGKVSQGIRIGSDVSYLLAEIVLAQVDHNLKVEPHRAYRWYDDYEIACDTHAEAEKVLARLTKELDAFKLRLNPTKTRIVRLPEPTDDDWHGILIAASQSSFTSAQNMVRYFDTAFRLHQQYPTSPVLLYALAVLFRVRCPSDDVASVAHSGITQALLAEPGVSQKAFALLTFWHLNGMILNKDLITRTIDRIVQQHDTRGVSSDVAWALAFCLQYRLKLSRESAVILARCNDDCILLLALHLHTENLLATRFNTTPISRLLTSVDLDGEHWLLGYEASRHGFMSESDAAVKANPMFADLLARKVTFYRRQLPGYAAIVHPGGAPEWAVRSWLDVLRADLPIPKEWMAGLPVADLMHADLAKLAAPPETHDDTVADLLDVMDSGEFAALIADEEHYRA